MENFVSELIAEPLDDSLLGLLPSGGGSQLWQFSQTSNRPNSEPSESVVGVPDRRGRRGFSAAAPARDKRRRDYCFTANLDNREAGEDAIGRLKQDKLLKYFVVGHENAPETGQYHLQGYIYHKNAVAFEAVRRRYPGWHFEACKGSALQNMKYCKKGNDFVEFGEAPKDKYDLSLT